jgi:hypothetical protein
VRGWPMPADRPHDVSSLTAAQLERARRDLEISLALAFPGSPVRVSIMAEMTAIDAELAERKMPGAHANGKGYQSGLKTLSR